jgi:1-acyl-sn-glycerol-3-phosphate acyltransferase
LKLRLVYRLLRVIIHMFLGMAICAFLFPWSGMAERDRHTRRWSRQLLAMCGVRVEHAGEQPAVPHAMVVANHVSWLDIFVINALYPCRFVAKAEIRGWPMIGWLAYKAGTVFIARGDRRDLRHIFKNLVDRLHTGERIGFFPEGTTSAQGHVLPFHPNLFEAAIDAQVPVQPFALSYLNRAGEYAEVVDFTGDTSFTSSMVAILSGPALTARVQCLAPIDTAGQHRRELAQAAHVSVATALAACEV